MVGVFTHVVVGHPVRPVALVAVTGTCQLIVALTAAPRRNKRLDCVRREASAFEIVDAWTTI